MTIEISVETYLFTCARCAARWTESYQVSQEVDDAGDIRSFYRHGGVPCEAPVSGNVECPNCHATHARRDPLYGGIPDIDPAQAIAETRDHGLPHPFEVALAACH